MDAGPFCRPFVYPLMNYGYYGGCARGIGAPNHLGRIKTMRMKALLGGVGFAALMLLGSAAPAQAQPWDRGGGCYERIQHAERRLDRAIERWGRHSEAARDARRDLEDARDRCRRRHDDWDRRDRRF